MNEKSYQKYRISFIKLCLKSIILTLIEQCVCERENLLTFLPNSLKAVPGEDSVTLKGSLCIMLLSKFLSSIINKIYKPS